MSSYRDAFNVHDDLASVWSAFYSFFPENGVRKAIRQLLEENEIPLTQEKLDFLKSNWKLVSTSPGKVLDALKGAD